MNTRFSIFMRSVDDDILEEAQLPVPRKRRLFRTAGLAACLCIAMGAYCITMSGFGAKNESVSNDLLTDTFTMAAFGTTAQKESDPENSNADTKRETILPTPTEAGNQESLLPANAVICNFSISGDEKQIDFSVGDMDFSLTASENEGLADEKLRNVLLSDEEKKTITWYSEDGDTEYALEMLEGDYSLLYSTAEEIAENLGIEIAD